MTCACRQPLWAPESIERGHCEHCHLYGPAPAGSRAIAPPIADAITGPADDDDDIEEQPRARRSPSAPRPPGPPCVHCDQPTHARTQRDDARQPAHLSCTGDYTPSVSEPQRCDDDGQELAARVRAVEICEHGHVRLPMWASGDWTVLPAAQLRRQP